MELISLLNDLTMIPALAGYERKMAQYMRTAMAPYADEIRIDTAGNLIAAINGSDQNAPRVMIFAHMDQLGFVVRKIEKDGFIRLERLGGIPEKVLPGTRMWVESEQGTVFPGVIGVKAHHATPAEEKYIVTPYSQLYLDIGAKSNDEVYKLGIEVGCPVVYKPSFEVLTGGRISATSLDDRGGCAILVKLAEFLASNRSAATIYLVGTTQEEFNLRGAMVAAAALLPDVAISLDVMISGDTPDLKECSELRLGGGPIIGMYSFHGRGTLNGTIPHPALVRLVKETAAREKITLQRNASTGILTDSAYVQLVGTGIPVIDLGFPARYTHTPVETCELSDLESLLSLVYSLVSTIGPDLDLSRE